MTSQTPNKNLTKPGHNEDIDSWDVPVNANSDTLDAALANTSYINLTGLSSYTLTYTDLAARSLAFTGTLNNATIPVKLTNGVSWEGEIINLTTLGGTSSALQMTWTGAGNTYTMLQGVSQTMIADGLNPSTTGWQPVGLEVPNYASASAFGSNAGAGNPTFSSDVTSFSPGQSITLTAAQARNRIIKVTGTFPNGSVTYRFPAGVAGSWTVMWSVSTTANSLLLFNSLGGGVSIGLIVSGSPTSGAATLTTDGAGLFFRTS